MRIVFIGTGAIGVPTLRALLRAPEHEVIGVVTQPDKPVGRRQQMEAPPIKAELTDNLPADFATEATARRRIGRANSRARAGCDRRHGLRTDSAGERARDSDASPA